MKKKLSKKESKKLQAIFLLTDKPIVSMNPKELKDHKLNAQYFSDLTESEYTVLKNDIEMRGIQEALHIRKLEDNVFQVLSGHQRKRIAIDLGMKTVPCIIRDDIETELDVEEFIIKANVLRRHLTDSQVAKCSMRLLEIEKVKAKERQKETLPKKGEKGFQSGGKISTTLEGKSRDKVAEQFGKSGRQLEKIQFVEKNAPESIKKQWENGEITTNKAYETIKELEQYKKPKNKSKVVFNKQGDNENIEWAKWSWNPYTGCKMDCSYCYAHEIADRFFPQKFEPTFYEHRLKAPENTEISEKEKNISGIHNVFVCSMGELFGDWVQKGWIEKILKTVKKHNEWVFIFLTKNPKRLLEFNFPDNAWVGATIDFQKRVKPTEDVLRKVKAKVKFVSCEPLKEKIIFNDISVINWLIIGGQRKTKYEPEFQPKWEWVESLMKQAREQNIKIYFKPNLTVRPKEYPKE